jgi:NADPH2:quinone reductase
LTCRTSLNLLAPRGCLINYGQLSGELPAVELTDLMNAGSVFITKYGPRAGLAGPARVASFISEALACATRRPAVVSSVAGRFSLDRAKEAYSALESGPHGKILVLPQEQAAVH